MKMINKKDLRPSLWTLEIPQEAWAQLSICLLMRLKWRLSMISEWSMKLAQILAFIEAIIEWACYDQTTRLDELELTPWFTVIAKMTTMKPTSYSFQVRDKFQLNLKIQNPDTILRTSNIDNKMGVAIAWFEMKWMNEESAQVAI